jgi:hypothetical protein
MGVGAGGPDTGRPSAMHRRRRWCLGSNGLLQAWWTRYVVGRMASMAGISTHSLEFRFPEDVEKPLRSSFGGVRHMARSLADPQTL